MHLAQREVTMGAAHQWGAMMDLKQENDVKGFLLEEAHSGCNMQSGLKRARVRMGTVGHHCHDLGLHRRWPKLIQSKRREEEDGPEV